MVKVRLARAGSKGRPYYHIVVADIQKPRDGRFIEQLGTYDPAKPETSATLDHDRLAYWTGVGAQVSDRVAKIARELAKAAPAAEPAAS